MKHDANKLYYEVTINDVTEAGQTVSETLIATDFNNETDRLTQAARLAKSEQTVAIRSLRPADAKMILRSAEEMLPTKKNLLIYQPAPEVPEQSHTPVFTHQNFVLPNYI